MADTFSHIDNQGNLKMVDVSGKQVSCRDAVATGRVLMKPTTLDRIVAGDVAKGNVLSCARIAGIMAAKRTSTLIPLCHPLPISHIDIRFSFEKPDTIRINASVRSTGQTGVEMEALTAVSVAGLTIYDMCKAVDRGMMLTDICLLEKKRRQERTF